MPENSKRTEPQISLDIRRAGFLKLHPKQLPTLPYNLFPLDDHRIVFRRNAINELDRPRIGSCENTLSTPLDNALWAMERFQLVLPQNMCLIRTRA